MLKCKPNELVAHLAKFVTPTLWIETCKQSWHLKTWYFICFCTTFFCMFLLSKEFVFLSRYQGKGQWATRFLSWFQTSISGIENKEIKLSSFPFLLSGRICLNRGLSCCFDRTLGLGKWRPYFDRQLSNTQGGILKPLLNQKLKRRPEGENLGEGRIKNPGQALPLSFYLFHLGKQSCQNRCLGHQSFGHFASCSNSTGNVIICQRERGKNRGLGRRMRTSYWSETGNEEGEQFEHSQGGMSHIVGTGEPWLPPYRDTPPDTGLVRDPLKCCCLFGASPTPTYL